MIGEVGSRDPSRGAQMERRAAARLAAVQALYQLEQTGLGVDTVVAEFKAHRLGADLDGATMHDADDAFFEDVGARRRRAAAQIGSLYPEAARRRLVARQDRRDRACDPSGGALRVDEPAGTCRFGSLSTSMWKSRRRFSIRRRWAS